MLLSLIKAINDQIETENKKKTEFDINLKMHNDLMLKLDEINKEINTIDIDEQRIKDKIFSLEKNKDNLTEQIVLSQTCERWNQLMSIKTNLLNKLQGIPDEESKYTLTQLMEYERLLSGDTIDIIKTKISKIQEYKIYEQTMIKYNEQETLKSECLRLCQQATQFPTMSVKNDIEEITKRITLIELSTHRLECPHCSNGVYLKGKTLAKFPEGEIEFCSFTIQTDKQKLEDTENRYNEGQRLLQRIKSLKDTIDNLTEILNPVKPNIRFDMNQCTEVSLNNQLSAIQNVPLIDIESEKKKIEMSAHRKLLSNELDQINKEINTLNVENANETEISILQTELAHIISELSKYKGISDTYIRLITIRNDISNQIKSVEINNSYNPELLSKLQNDHSKYLEEHKHLSINIVIQQQLYRLVSLYNEYNSYCVSENTLKNRLAKLQKIRATLITAEHVLLDSVLSNINDTISNVLNEVFNEPISLTINSLKKLKSNDRIKPEINLNITHNGGTFSSISELSGGEKRKVSLALMIAFTQYGNTPFLFLDETLEPLDFKSRDLMISTMKKYLSDKLIICVNQDTIEGMYDSVIQFEK